MPVRLFRRVSKSPFNASGNASTNPCASAFVFCAVVANLFNSVTSVGVIRPSCWYSANFVFAAWSAASASATLFSAWDLA